MFSAATKTGSQPSAAYNYIEDVFSTYLYTGNDATQAINNGIDLAGKGGLTWIKARTGTQSHYLFDSIRGTTKAIFSDLSDAQSTVANSLTSFNSNGFTLGSFTDLNNSVDNYASWTFRKQPKFFDVVTYTGTGSTQNISHSLGSVPGFIIIKPTSASGFWWCYQKDLGNDVAIKLNATSALSSDPNIWNSTTPTSTQFTVGASSQSNFSGRTYVAYLFAHNAGGFGTTGTDNVISCGSYTGTGTAGNPINLGYEAQYVLIKRTDSTGNWFVIDNMRGLSETSSALLIPNLTNTESVGNYVSATATGFKINSTASALNASGGTYIYMAIRRPMKVPTDATTVFSPVTYTGNSSTQVLTTGFTVDTEIINCRNPGSQGWQPAFNDRLRGNGITLTSSSTAAETDYSSGIPTEFQSNTAVNRTSAYFNYDGGGGTPYTYVTWALARRPGFFDEVCYTGTGATNTQSHNLNVAPELIISKTRSPTASNWITAFDFTSTNMRQNYLNLTNSAPSYTYATWGYFTTRPTSTSFTLTAGSVFNEAGTQSVSYLFATCPGVSKVGSYTGNGTTQAIACGFTGGARFVLIKRTDSTGDWYVYDTARGMTTLTDPYLLLNSTAAESATLGSVTTTTGGFTVNASILAAINTSSASYIFMAIA